MGGWAGREIDMHVYYGMLKGGWAVVEVCYACPSVPLNVSVQQSAAALCRQILTHDTDTRAANSSSSCDWRGGGRRGGETAQNIQRQNKYKWQLETNTTLTQKCTVAVILHLPPIR